MPYRETNDCKDAHDNILDNARLLRIDVLGLSDESYIVEDYCGMKIAIYGAGEVGKRVCHNLMRFGIRPSFFLDRKAKAGETCLDVPLFQIDDYPTIACRDTTVVLALADGLEHKVVADKLYVCGFRKLVFLPVAYTMPSRLKKELTILYNEYMNGCVTGLVRDYSCYSEVSFLDAEQAVVSEGIYNITAWVPLEIVFTENLEHWPGDKRKLRAPYSYYDRNIATNYWMLNLMDYLQGIDHSCDTYLSMYERNGGAKPDIEKRRLQFELFEHEFDFGMDFFVQSAPEAMWNDRGYFNIVGGNHRIMYLYAKGCRYFPLRISRQDFAQWQGAESVMPEVAARIRYPVSHPAFQHVVIHGTGRLYHVFKSIEKRYGHVDMSNRKILDSSHTEGFFGRQFARMKGTKVTIAVTSDELTYYEHLSRLMPVPDVELMVDSNASKDFLHYDIIISRDERGALVIEELKGVEQ